MAIKRIRVVIAQIYQADPMRRSQPDWPRPGGENQQVNSNNDSQQVNATGWKEFKEPTQAAMSNSSFDTVVDTRRERPYRSSPIPTAQINQQLRNRYTVAKLRFISINKKAIELSDAAASDIDCIETVLGGLLEAWEEYSQSPPKKPVPYTGRFANHERIQPSFPPNTCTICGLIHGFTCPYYEKQVQRTGSGNFRDWKDEM